MPTHPRRDWNPGLLIFQTPTVPSNDAPKPTEGGWGWAAVIASIIVYLCIGATDRGFGILLVGLTERFPDSSMATLTSAMGLCHALINIVGSVTTILMNKGVSARIILVSKSKFASFCCLAILKT